MGQFTYKSRSQGDWEKRERQTGSRFSSFAQDDFAIYSPKKGDNYIRILPPTWEDPHHYGYDLWLHYQVGPDGGTVICNSKMKGQPCPICQTHAKYEATGREDAGDYKPTRRVLVWLINRAEEQSGEKDKGKPALWAMPWTLDRDISKLCRDRQSGELYQIDHPTEGFDITFEREGEPPIVKYIGIQLARRPSSVAQEHLNYIAEHPVTRTLLWRTYEEVAALNQGNYPVDAPQAVQQEVPGVATIDNPPMELPAIVTPSFCSKTVNMKGEKWGCALEEGHKEDHDFGRLLSDEKPQTSLFDAPPQPQPVAVAQTGTVSARASALRARFDTGRK